MKKKTIDSLRSDVESAEKALDSMSSRFFNSGAHLADEVFIPEYLGFEEHVNESVNQEVKRFYSKECNEDVFTLVRSLNTDNEWIVFRKGLPPLLIKIKSMLHALIIFDSIGFDVNVDNYVQWYRQQQSNLHVGVSIS